MIYTENVTPNGLAAKLAEYITDPSTIRTYVKAHFGRAPTVDQCRALRRKVETRRIRHMGQSDIAFVTVCKRHNGPYELDADGIDRCTQCKDELRRVEQAKAERAALIERQLADLQAKVERERQWLLELTEQVRTQELAVAVHTLENLGKPVLFHDLVKEVAAAFEMTPADVLGECRQRVYVDARATLAKILHKRGSSYPMIGKRLNRDHSSIMNLLRGYDFRSKRNPLIALVVERLA